MKKTIGLLLLLLSFGLNAQQNPVVVELFTSQGCSSCPAADKNLTTIIKKANESGKLVYGLSFHVDYWNYLGWKDPYSQKEFTARQRSYAQIMNLRSIYTPQIVVNGKSETVGSDVEETKKLIGEASAQKPLYIIRVDDLSIDKEKLSFSYSIDQSPSSETINIAVVEKDIENIVPRGENSGRKLHHDNVVRYFISKPLERQQKVEVNLPQVKMENTSIILYIQNQEMHTVGVTSRSLR